MLTCPAIVRAEGAGRLTPLDTAEMRRQLLAGRWALVDSFEHGGRRYLVARCGFVPGRDAADLTIRERQVLGHVALGRSNKVVAFDLGLAPSTVATHLAQYSAP